MKEYDSFIIGHLSIDEILDADGNGEFSAGGAVIYASYPAVMSGNKVGFFIKTDPRDKMIPYLLPVQYDDIYWAASTSGTTSIRNQFLDEHHERRTTTAIAHASMIMASEIPTDIKAKVYHLAGLIKGDFEDEMIKVLSERGKVALDMQGYLRVADAKTGVMEYFDWDKKETYLPYVYYLKTDAAEAEIMTGLSDRREAARQMIAWGVKEAMITHHDEVLVYDGETFYTCPLKPLSLDGRTGRGDTTFSTYITERQRQDIQTSLNYATQLVSLKMQTPGPFKGTRADVEAFAKKHY